MNIQKSSSLSKRRRNGVDLLDRISGFPDPILSHILSFLPTKDAVATHILSKSWSFLWTAISNLDFRYPAADHCNEGHQSLKSSAFVDFVNHVLLLHKVPCLSKFSLTLETESVPSNVEAQINSWIYTAIARNVDHLSVSAGKNFKLPIQTQRLILGCEGLRSLELNCNISISSDIVVSLPRLESLRLTLIDFKGDEAYSKLLGGSPVLKYLFMDVYMDNLIVRFFRFVIPSTSLRHLELYSHNKYPQSIGAICVVRLEAPSLEYIKIQDQVSFIYTKTSLSSLVEANFQHPDVYNHIKFFSIGVAYVMESFGCAKVLTLSAHVIRALSHATNKMTRKFERLTRLEVTIDQSHWSSLQDFIKLSDGLEALTIKKDGETSEKYLNNSSWKQLDLVPTCLSNSLRTVSIGDFYGNADELVMVSDILKHGSVLRVMEISFDESVSDLNTKFEMVKKISKFPRKSPVCEVDFF